MEDISNDNKLLSIGAASEYLGVSIDTLRRWEKKGKIESKRSPGGHRYFDKSDLDGLFGTKYERDEETKVSANKEEKSEEVSKNSTIKETPQQTPTEAEKPKEDEGILSTNETQSPTQQQNFESTQDNTNESAVDEVKTSPINERPSGSPSVLIPEIKPISVVQNQQPQASVLNPPTVQPTQSPHLNDVLIKKEKDDSKKTIIIVGVIMFLIVAATIGAIIVVLNNPPMVSPIV